MLEGTQYGLKMIPLIGFWTSVSITLILFLVTPNDQDSQMTFLVQSAAFASMWIMNRSMVDLKTKNTILGRSTKPIRCGIVGPYWIICVTAIVFSVMTPSHVTAKGFVWWLILGMCCFLIILSIFQLAIVTITWLIDLELHKPLDAEYDSTVLYYTRCLCLTNSAKRVILMAGPFYTMTCVLSLFWIVGHHQTDSDSPCKSETELYHILSVLLFTLYALVLTLTPMFCSKPRNVQKSSRNYMIASVILVTINITSIGWSFLGTRILNISTCDSHDQFLAIVKTERIVLVIFSLLFALLSSTVSLEGFIVDYYMEHSTSDSSLSSTYQKIPTV